PFYIGDQPAGTQVSGWLDAWTPAPSVYAVKARSSAAVAAAVDFARDNNLRLVIKGGGHSYQGTSNAPDSLLVWTRAMNEVKLHEAFVPAGCAGRVAPVPAVSCGAGATWIDLYHAVTEGAGRYVQGGGCTSVGVAGLVQSGGFGSFSKRFGTAASGLLEAQVVTADGRVRTVNACSDPDLFWALKGGGGGSFGVITRLTLRTHELPEFFGAAWGRIRANSDDAFRKLLARFIDFYAADLLNAHWGEAVNIQTGNTVELSMVCQALDREQAPRVWQPLFEWIRSAPADFTVTGELGARATAARHWWDVAGNPSMIADRRPGAPAGHGWWDGDQGQVGAFIHAYDSLWLPASLLEPHQRRRLADALFAGSRYQQIRLHFNKGLAGAPSAAIAAARDTATNPGVSEAFALAIIADGERASYPGMDRPPLDLAAARRDAHAIDLATAELRRLAPAAGSYVSESNYFNARWQQAFWGPNYPRLRSVKDRYDPDGLFFVHHGVGSEDWSPDGFTRAA
ncbi:MAG TPA: FAD-binding oxidoreductase, partial [Steroidobacteraceae bacterium]|nr:FAD-binding oxidoreductase [Steroidobacteraceae bacterium]